MWLNRVFISKFSIDYYNKYKLYAKFNLPASLSTICTLYYFIFNSKFFNYDLSNHYLILFFEFLLLMNQSFKLFIIL